MDRPTDIDQSTLRTTTGATPDLERATPGLDRTSRLRSAGLRLRGLLESLRARRLLDGLRRRLTPRHG